MSKTEYFEKVQKIAKENQSLKKKFLKENKGKKGAYFMAKAGLSKSNGMPFAPLYDLGVIEAEKAE